MREVIRQRQKYVGAECLEQRAPSVSGQSEDLSELMLCVATMGMHLGCRERLKNFSSPVGSFSPTVAKYWYSSQMKKHLAEVTVPVCFRLWNAIEDSPLKIQFHHHA